jgi:hypothetical protein
LPNLPKGIRHLYCSYTNITELPLLPDSLIHISCASIKIAEFPPLPDKLEYINYSYKDLPLKKTGEAYQDYIPRIRIWQEMTRTKKRAREIKEELVAAVWHPRRVQRLLDLCGEDFDFEML